VTIAVASAGICGLFFFDSISIGLVSAFVALAVFATVARFDRSFIHPTQLKWKSSDGASHVFLDDQEFDLKLVWSLGFLIVCNGVIRTASGSKSARLLLGKDALDEQIWHKLQIWHVWRQRV
jgi:hypothetical protein